MAQIELAGVAKSFGSHRVLEHIDLGIEAGEYCVILGPSGCGKSTLLRLAAGLEEVSAGRIRIDGRDVTRLPPKERGLAMVFQSYALYPHMSAYDNMAFGLRLAGQNRARVRERILAVARSLDIDGLLERKPSQLSGGQRQRVAIGRAIVREPRAFLLDEPLSNLDADLRVRMRLELARLHRRLGRTMVQVTHDQTEAMTLADRMVVLEGGRLAQQGPPLELYHRPVDLFVAGFIGTPRMNLIPARLAEAHPRGTRVELPGGIALRLAADASRLARGDPVTLGIRPEHVGLGGAVENRIRGRVERVEHLGDHALVYLDWASDHEPLTIRCNDGQTPQRGEPVEVHLAPGACHLFDTAGLALPAGAAFDDSTTDREP
jgi:multiple sugar transport system ATP-binding protein